MAREETKDHWYIIVKTVDKFDTIYWLDKNYLLTPDATKALALESKKAAKTLLAVRRKCFKLFANHEWGLVVVNKASEF